MIGYGFTGETKEELFTFWSVKGGNGKGTIFETLHFILGDYAGVLDHSFIVNTQHQKHSTYIAGLKGKRLVNTSELPANHSFNSHSIKELTGGDVLIAHKMGTNPIEFKPQFTVIASGNDLPRISVDDSITRRMRKVDFTNTPKVRDGMLKQRLKDSAPAIMG